MSKPSAEMNALKRRARTLEELLEIGALLASSLDYTQILESITHSALALLQCDSAEIWSEDGPANAKSNAKPDPAMKGEASFRLLGAAGTSGFQRKAEHLRIGSPPEGDGNRREAWLTELRESLNRALPFETYKPTRVEIAAMDTGAGRGYFTVGREEDRPFSEEELYVLEKLALQAGLSLSNSNRFAETEAARDRALEENRLLREDSDFVGTAPATRDVLALVKQVAPTRAPVLILGERGTGKELIAEEMHKRGNRPGELVRVNCAGITESLMESELFGHEKGAFTGAEKQKKGLLEEAHRGTIFLDEIGDMPETMQVKLLRFLQQRTIRRVGGVKDITLDVRVVAATNRDIAQDVNGEFFRRDLYDRISTVVLRIPPLRERREDILHLARHFLKRYAALEGKSEIKGFSPRVLRALENRDWPGNVRELENTIYRLVILHESGGMLDRPPLSRDADAVNYTGPATAADDEIAEESFADRKAEFEEQYVRAALTLENGNISRAAKRSGLDRGNFKLKMRKYGISAAEMKSKKTG